MKGDIIMSQVGNTQITFIFLFSSHAKWMENSHYKEGELALLNYNVVKGPELSNPLDPTSEPTDNTSYALTEVYKTPQGLEDHWKQGSTNWEDFNAFVELNKAAQTGKTLMHLLNLQIRRRFLYCTALL
jgi:hypothetical protein